MPNSSADKKFPRFSRGRILWIAAIAVAFALGLLASGGKDAATSGQHEHGAAMDGSGAPARETVWTCSMHPQIKLPKPGQCPICFMDLIPLEDDGSGDLGPRTLVMSEGAAALADIQTVPVRREVATARVPLIGKVTYDETSLKVISAWTAGRLDTLFVDFTGTEVVPGQALASLYSPDLYAGQVELLSALEARRQLQNSTDPAMSRSAEATVASARDRLKLWGLNAAQLQRIESTGRASYHLRITSPIGGAVVKKSVDQGMYVGTGTPLFSVADLSGVWVTLEAYESDLPWLSRGQHVDFTVAALPGRQFSGEVAFIDPVLNAKTRTVGVRLNVDNSQGLLKPGMFVDAVAQSSLTGSDGQASLVIPATAALVTGKRAVVYVRLPDQEKPTFEGREVVLGPRAGDDYLVVSGLKEGEHVVTRGNFKIDSALQIQAKPSMMSEDTGTADIAAAPTIFQVPADFREQLGPLVQAALDLQAALAEDDDPTAAQAAAQASRALGQVDGDQVLGQAGEVWRKNAGMLREAFKGMAEAPEIEGRRRWLLKTTDPLWEIMTRFGYQPAQTIRRFNCPMANDNNGGDWLQLDPVTANPYYGDAMLRCGSQTDTLGASAAREGR